MTPTFGMTPTNRGPLLRRLGFCFGLQLDPAVGAFDGVFDAFAFVLLANLVGFFLHELGEGVDAAADVLSGFFLGGDERVVEALDLLAFGLIDGLQSKRLRSGRIGPGGCGVSDAVDGMMVRLEFFFGGANALNRK